MNAKTSRWKELSPEVKWAIWTLKSNGIRAGEYMDMMPFAVNMEEQYEATIKETSKGTQLRYDRLAEKLRELWPVGDKVIKNKDKESRIAWRDSITNISIRLKRLNDGRKIGDNSDEDILRCARAYLARFEDDRTYMQVLKYFIMKEKTVAGKTVYTSTLADMLDTQTDAVKLQFDETEEYNTMNLDFGETLG